LGDRGGPDRRALLAYIAAPLRERPMRFDVGPLETPQDAVRALHAISEGLERGEITQPEMDSLVKMIAAFTSAIAISDLDIRMKIIEAERGSK
jgi:hypothetical protein